MKKHAGFEDYDVYKESGDRLRLLREVKNLTLEDLSAVLDCTDETYAWYVDGKGQIGIEAIKTAAKYYGVSVDTWSD